MRTESQALPSSIWWCTTKVLFLLKYINRQCCMGILVWSWVKDIERKGGKWIADTCKSQWSLALELGLGGKNQSECPEKLMNKFSLPYPGGWRLGNIATIVDRTRYFRTVVSCEKVMGNHISKTRQDSLEQLNEIGSMQYRSAQGRSDRQEYYACEARKAKKAIRFQKQSTVMSRLT